MQTGGWTLIIAGDFRAFSTLRFSDGVTHLTDAREDLTERLGLEIHDRRQVRQFARRVAHFVFGYGAHIAERLGDDDVGSELLQRRDV